MLNDPLFTPCENRKEDGYRVDMALSGPPSLNPSPARLQTPSVDVETTSSPSAVAPTDAAHNATEDRSENAETVHPVSDAESTDSKPLSASHISDTAPEASIDRETDAISSSAASSASNTSAMDGEYTNPTLCPDRVPGHSSVPSKDPLPTQSIDAEKPPTSESSRACSAEKSLDGMPTLSEGAADIPTPIVVIPPPPRSPDLVRCQDQVPEEQDWDSGPSDDEKDADYEDSSSEEERIDRSLPSSKRQKINLISEGGALSNQETQPFPGSHALSQNETTPTSDRIPVQGFFRVGCHGTQVTYYFEFSQTALSLPISHQSSSSPPPEMGNKRKRTRLLYTPEEDAYIIELKNDNVPWAEIEERFAERFPYRKATSLQAHYFNKLKP